MTKDSKAVFWQQHIDNCGRSSLSQKHYCEKHSLALATFSYWKKKLKAKQDLEQIRFYPLTVQPAKAVPSPRSAGLSIHFTENGWRVELEDDFSAPALNKLMCVLRQI